jgi:hypothetical protein
MTTKEIIIVIDKPGKHILTVLVLGRATGLVLGLELSRIIPGCIILVSYVLYWYRTYYTSEVLEPRYNMY